MKLYHALALLGERSLQDVAGSFGQEGRIATASDFLLLACQIEGARVKGFVVSDEGHVLLVSAETNDVEVEKGDLDDTYDGMRMILQAVEEA